MVMDWKGGEFKSLAINEIDLDVILRLESVERRMSCDIGAVSSRHTTFGHP
jgi:hypothetical protein